MSHLVVINLGVGDLQNGCAHVTAQISLMGERYPIQYVGSLPPAPELEYLYHRWQLLYREYYRERGSATRAITIATSGITNFSEVEFSDLAQQVKEGLNRWLNSESFHAIDRKLSRAFDPDDEIRVIVETNDPLLRRLPWHLWNFFEDFPQAEVALSVAEYERITRPTKTATGQVRILAILGNSDQIDLQFDRQVLESLPHAAPVFLTQPSYAVLHERLWDSHGWDILFFAGHSQTEENTGRIDINSTESLTLDQLRHALKRAIRQGLKLAIFNSCDGLGLAQALADLQIPQVIVMRELIPDGAAQAFFRDFLTLFARGHSLYAAVREAREKLEKLEGDYPCATWLPVICQNPAEEPMTWSRLQGVSPRSGGNPLSIRRVVAIGLLATVAILAGRQVGWMQAWELRMFDQLMRLRPAETADPRLLLVTITEKDVQMQNPQERRGSSLSDQALSKLLAKLRVHQPRVIGLDLYRDFDIDTAASDLDQQLQQTPQFVAVCEVGESSENPGTRPLAGVPAERISFSDLPIDPDGVIRRQILAMAPAPNSFCVTDLSFSLRLALLYLAQQDIPVQRTANGTLQIGETKFPKLQPETGGYHQLDALGYQTLLNYRAVEPIADQVTLTEILDGSLGDQLGDLVRDRIVLIGTVAPSFKDYFATPYSQGAMQTMPGVMIHAHMTSQILSAVLDGRILLQGLPLWGTVLWIGGGAVLGGMWILVCRSPLLLIGAIGLSLVGLTGVSWVGLIQGVWLPLVPSGLALVTTVGSAVIYRAGLHQRKLSM
ncbi:MAG: CHASE2 domain-containing protein [Elainella sp. Prado103]|nr:CHASE2 domain-containing protein [Elainella sp. Prado103]